jgi:hypothetical protein
MMAKKQYNEGRNQDHTYKFIKDSFAVNDNM